ncbi:hypothetical protein Cme02nite_35460 [Catellatospora methionotrophica]|uniref:Uncharacterized protein n=1 Tax=Catellatospora methionotrophica TaxID=121620 RepID=A0A8J3PG01_9ACTN|nr:hypothetical protein [Catellatospora methionotrophica]GIG15214.1 hypothetical protein Cme02nite_35460 [Catellatospora methionotrophica]
MQTTSLLRRIGVLGALTGVSLAAGLAVSSPAQAATTLKVTTVICNEETDELGDDSPYFLVFAASTTNPGATAFGKWGPGGWDDEIASGDSYSPNGTVATGVSSSSWRLISLMVEEDYDNDLTASEITWIGNNMFNQYQISFWKPTSTMISEMRAALRNTTAMYLSNDDMVATDDSSIGGWAYYVGDGGSYQVKYTLP